jgi:two-component system response regulator MprA
MRILVVEDYEPLRESILRGLVREGYSVDGSGDGSIALALALESPPDLVVLDLMLPGLDGFEFLRRYRSGGKFTPILMLTARDAITDRIEGLDSGADDYMVKPFAFAEFLARVRALLRRTSESQSLRVGDLEIDPTRRSARRGGLEIPLTPREFEVLEFLASERGKPVSRDEIRQRIYPDSEIASSNVVEVFVGTLRRKLEEGGRSRLLHTRRGFGYILKESPP